MITFALLMAMQAAPGAPEQPVENAPAPWPDPERELGMVDGYTTESDAKARATMTAFAACVVDGSTDRAAELLQRDFTTTTYRNGLQNLSRDNEGCARKVGLSGRMRMSNLSFAGALAEALLERRGRPVNALLAQAAAGAAAPTYSFTDGVAMCTVRSAPDQVSALFATEVGDASEASAVNALASTAALCARAANARKPLSISPAGLRPMLATATNRTVATLKDA